MAFVFTILNYPLPESGYGKTADAKLVPKNDIFKRPFLCILVLTFTAENWLGKIAKREPKLFAHWQMGILPTAE
jgi:hypothetical protein